jgi:hypothetical protein
MRGARRSGQARSLGGPTPRLWPTDECERLLDVAEASLRESIQDLRLRWAVSTVPYPK